MRQLPLGVWGTHVLTQYSPSWPTDLLRCTKQIRWDIFMVQVIDLSVLLTEQCDQGWLNVWSLANIVLTQKNHQHSKFIRSMCKCEILNIIITFGPYWSIGHPQVLFRRPNLGPVSEVVPRCIPSSLFQPPDHGASCFLGGLAFSFPVGSRYRSFAFGECVQSISSIFWGFHHLLVVAWSVSRVLCCWWSQAIGS